MSPWPARRERWFGAFGFAMMMGFGAVFRASWWDVVHIALSLGIFIAADAGLTCLCQYRVQIRGRRVKGDGWSGVQIRIRRVRTAYLSGTRRNETGTAPR